MDIDRTENQAFRKLLANFMQKGSSVLEQFENNPDTAFRFSYCKVTCF